jgi:hypothetical protein
MSALQLKGRKPKTTEPKKPAILVFGEPGAGKTYTALDFPAVFFVDTERGATQAAYQDKLANAGGVYFGIEDGSQNFDEVLQQVRALRSLKHDYKTLVIDSFTKLFNIEIANEQERLKKAGKKDEFGLSKKPAVAKSRELVGLLSTIDMNVLLICHEAPNWSEGEQKGIKADSWDKLAYELDLVLHIRKLGGSRKAFVIKSRLDKFPESTSIDWSYDEISTRWGKSIVEKNHEPVALATPEQLARVAQLNDTLKTTPEEIDKHLSYGEATQYADMSTDKIAYVINRLEAKLPK